MKESMELQLFTTMECNLRCTYCSEANVLDSQKKVTYSDEELDDFIQNNFNDKDLSITFYGGEPTMNIPFMEKVMRRYPDLKYQLQTNGTRLKMLPAWMINMFNNILISADGNEEITDTYRGEGIYKLATEGAAYVREVSNSVTVARVTLADPRFSVDSVKDLLSKFDRLYFQFVHFEVGYEPEALESKKKVLKEMIEYFFSQEDTFPKIIPLMGIVRNILFPDIMSDMHKGLPQCRVSSGIVNVLPNGDVFPCPDYTWVPETKMGNIHSTSLSKSILQPSEEFPCKKCNAFKFCQYNCMKNLHRAYISNDVEWRTKVVEPICELMRYIGNEIESYDLIKWFSKLEAEYQYQITECSTYKCTEIVP
jgi:uncharacterized protein